nr:PASTA domain-containing protein [Methylonatrum kenyense]
MGEDEAGARVAVPDFSGLTETAARRLAKAQGLRLEVAYEARGDRDVGAGQAFKQTPSRDARVVSGASVIVVFAQN